MSALHCLFIVQGEGRGHLTQALALRAMLRRAGHHVGSVLVGRGSDRDVPGYFRDKIDAPIHFFDSTRFVPDARSRSIRWGATVRSNVVRWRRFRESLALIDAQIQHHQPDVVINFYEALAGLYYARYRPAVPMVAVAHQYMLLHPHYQFPRGFWFQRRATTVFTRLTATGAACKLALSLYPSPDLPSERLCVLPPLLRDELFTQPLDRTESFFLVYLWHRGLATDILRWHERHPDVTLHCFWDNPEAETVDVYDETLTFHRLHDERFLSMMARCQGVVSTAGFECTAEALYLGKPLLMVPIQEHFEQHCNAIDGPRAGAGVVAADFAIDRLIDFLPQYQQQGERFRTWVACAEARFIEELEQVARHTARGGPPRCAPLPRRASGNSWTVVTFSAPASTGRVCAAIRPRWPRSGVTCRSAAPVSSRFFTSRSKSR